jgi:hypothetical protein
VKQEDFMDKGKPADGKETTMYCARHIFKDGKLANNYRALCNVKASWSNGTISFFPQEDNKTGISVSIVDLVEFLKTVSEA